MSVLILLGASGLGLAALYFLVAAGLSLVFGLADVLNFAHGVFVAIGAYATWWADGSLGYLPALGFGIATGTATAVLVERSVIRPLYQRQTQQILATVGLSLAGVAALEAGFGVDARSFAKPGFARGVVTVGGAQIPADRLVLIAAALTVLGAIVLVLRRSRFGLVIRAGAEDREMVTALGIDVQRAFTGVFALSGAAAALAGGLGCLYFGAVAPDQGGSLLISAIVVIVIGGLGSVPGTAAAAVLVGLVQTLANYYGPLGAGDVSVVVVMAGLLLVRPGGLAGVRV